MYKKMEDNHKNIAFCITCMNRLVYLRQTLEQNMEDNYLPYKVLFALLDYHSTDGLEEWCKSLKKYIDAGLLVYYKTNEPESYHRSHSRNMIFRLSDADIVCNLDADNYLGKGFAADIINCFNGREDVFYTSDYHIPDVTGRLCVLKKHFLQVGGYNESFSGWGVEDVELIDRLKKEGLKQDYFRDSRYYNAIRHSDRLRVSEEQVLKTLDEAYISYVTPWKTMFLLLHSNLVCETGILINNKLRHYNLPHKIEETNDWSLDERSREVLSGDIGKGRWSKSEGSIETETGNIRRIYRKEGGKLINDGNVFYRMTTEESISLLVKTLTEASNYKQAMACIKSGAGVNPDGFGRGVVYKNFNDQDKIILD
jgi:GT2 family glycosyltransferase